MASHQQGDPVTDIFGIYRGETGIFVRWPSTFLPRSAHVHLGCHDHPNETSCIYLYNLQFNNQQENHHGNAAPPVANAIVINDIDNVNINNLVTTEML
jgi:hypothetical protein